MSARPPAGPDRSAGSLANADRPNGRYEGKSIPMSLTTSGPRSRAQADPGQPGWDPATAGIAGLLRAARARLARLHPEAAHVAHRRGALLVDIRPAAQRASSGEIPGALLIERNVLEWRLDPASEARLPIVDRYDLPVMLICQEGYASSLAAATLQDLGLSRATDVIGGVTAWLQAGLPAFPPHDRSHDDRPRGDWRTGAAGAVPAASGARR